MIKYKIVKCCYDKILVNVAAYVIPGYMCVRCPVNRVPVYWADRRPSTMKLTADFRNVFANTPQMTRTLPSASNCVVSHWSYR